jgi:hypothetical protein
MKDKQDEYEYAGGSIGTFEQEPGTSPIYRHTHHLRATAPGFDPVAASRFGFESLSPLQPRLLARRPGNLPDASGSYFQVDQPGVLLYTAKPAKEGDGVVLRMTELTGAPVTARISSGVLALTSAERIEQDEEPGGTPLAPDGGGFLVPMNAYETATVRLQAAPDWAPIVLTARKDGPGGAVVLEWTGGVSPYTLRRSEDAPFSGPVDILVDEQAVTSHADPVLGDGRSYYYLVR